MLSLKYQNTKHLQRMMCYNVRLRDIETYKSEIVSYNSLQQINRKPSTVFSQLLHAVELFYEFKTLSKRARFVQKQDW